MIRMATVMVVMVFCAGTVWAADVIKLKRGVEFPHKFHQETLKDCKKCHEKDPPGKIEGFGRDWAHKVCRGCHSSRKPITGCQDCHKL